MRINPPLRSQFLPAYSYLKAMVPKPIQHLLSEAGTNMKKLVRLTTAGIYRRMPVAQLATVKTLKPTTNAEPRDQYGIRITAAICMSDTL
ncbi:hypothetical protein Trydic_g7005 [Trypoxylus dichotomus]